METRKRNFCFTLNNYTEDDEQHIVDLEGHKQIRYLIVGKEVGEEKQTPHLQGFIVFYNNKTFKQAKAFLGERYHVEICQGSVDQNIAYCSKDDEYFEFGERPKQGSRKDIIQIVEQVKNHVPIKDIVMNAPSYQSARHAEVLMKYQPMPEPMKRTIKWYWGATGTGKTRSAIEQSQGDFYMTMKDLKWWDGYYGQSYVIIDDFRKDFCTFHELLRILDRYPYRVNLKGSSMWLQPSTTHIIITSFYPPDQVYSTREDVKQLLRRIDEIIEF